jgi:hypothetical protein
MKSLKTLTFTAPRAAQKNSVAARRAKLVNRLEQQKLLVENPMHVRVVQRWVIQDNGIKAPVEVSKRVRPWWRADETGAVYLKVRYGSKAIEFEKGKSAILIKDKTKLASTIEMLIAAIRDGELDDQLAQNIPKVPSRTRQTA